MKRVLLSSVVVLAWAACFAQSPLLAQQPQAASAERGALYTPPSAVAPTAWNESAGAVAEFPASDLVRRLEAAEQELRQLRGEVMQLERLPPITNSHPSYVHTAPGAPTAEERLAALEKSATKVDAGPHFPSVRLSGFFHLDSGYFHQDANSFANYGDIQDGVGFRRARLQALGSVAEFTNYTLEMDFATAGRPSFMDVWVEQFNLPVVGNLRIGQFRQPFSIDALTSAKQLEFLERSLPLQAFVPLRRVGIMAYDKSYDEMWSWGYSIFKTGAFNGAPLGDTRFGTDIGDDGGYSASARLTHLLWYDEPAAGRYLLHAGASYDYSRITADNVPAQSNTYEARAVPEFFVGDPAGGGLTAVGTPFIADTGRLSANEFQVVGVEIAGQYGPAHFQSEYIATSVNQIGNPNVFYDGAYFQAGYFLTGENRTYNKMFGAFDKVQPFTEFFALGRHDRVCGWGAWELTGRWSYLNLNDPNAVPLAVASTPPVPNPGYINQATLGLNWYWNSFTKLQFDWMHIFSNTSGFGRSEMDIFAMRCQAEF